MELLVYESMQLDHGKTVIGSITDNEMMSICGRTQISDVHKTNCFLSPLIPQSYKQGQGLDLRSNKTLNCKKAEVMEQRDLAVKKTDDGGKARTEAGRDIIRHPGIYDDKRLFN